MIRAAPPRNGPYRGTRAARAFDPDRPVDHTEWPAYRTRLGQQIRDARLEADLTLNELAAKIAAHPRTLGRVERGQLNVTMRTLFRIARGIGVSLSEVLP